MAWFLVCIMTIEKDFIQQHVAQAGYCNIENLIIWSWLFCCNPLQSRLPACILQAWCVPEALSLASTNTRIRRLLTSDASFPVKTKSVSQEMWNYENFLQWFWGKNVKWKFFLPREYHSQLFWSEEARLKHVWKRSFFLCCQWYEW